MDNYLTVIPPPCKLAKITEGVDFFMWQSIVPALITGLITIVGLIVTYFLTIRNFKEEAQKQKLGLFLEKVESLPMEIQKLMDDILDKKNKNENIYRLKRIMSQLFAYGSKDAIKLSTHMQELTYELNDNPESVEKNKIIAYYILLICQLKYDLTGIEINPQYWYRMRLRDYKKIQTALDKANNDVVMGLNLSNFLLIK